MAGAGPLTKSGLDRLSLPDGWHSEPMGDRWLIISSPDAICTVDANSRCFRGGGFVVGGPTIGKTGTAGYSGRGWAARLHADAVVWLRSKADRTDGERTAIRPRHA